MLDSLMAGHYIGQKKRLDTEELRFYRAEREEFTVEDGCLLHGTSRSDALQTSTGSAV